MKTKLVIWGTNANDDRVLIAMELRPELNQVGLWVFPEEIASDDFAQKLFDEWRDSKEVPFPEGFTYTEQELTVTQSLLPDDLKVERSDLIQRAQAEWHFIVLSSKLKEAYHAEMEDLKERIERLEAFDESAWDALKGFWDKVQNQVRERNLFRDHIEDLRESTNHLFERLKGLRKKMDEEFSKGSKETMHQFIASLEEVEQKVKEGLRLNSAFEALKRIQQEYRDAHMTRDHRAKVWDRIDAAFKAVKEKRFGGKGGSSSSSSSDESPLGRIQRRYDGLLDAMQKMERSIRRDQDDLNFQHKKIEITDGQLEAQIRQAKIKMIEERVNSKEEKLREMAQTKTELESRMESIRQREAKQAERERLQAAKEQVKEKIAEQIKHQAEAMEEIADKIERAVEEVVDTAKAVAEVVADKVEDAIEDVIEDIKEKIEGAEPVEEEPAEEEPVQEEPSEEDKKEE
jgi:chromosome segregation ATPase